VLDFASCEWKINVVLSTNYLSKVLRPEVVLQIQTAQNRRLQITVSVEKFEELRRQIAYLIRYTQQIECIRYLNI
jgi:predicted nucleic acid-binding protein